MTTEATDPGAVSEAGMPASKRRILVGSDGSRKSLEAVRWAIEEARVHGGTVRVIVSWDVPNSIFLAPVWQESDYADNARKVLAEVFEEVDASNLGIPMEGETRMGPAGGVLVNESADADLLVVGSHGLGHGKLPGWHLGSVAGYCVHHAKCPTVVVRN